MGRPRNDLPTLRRQTGAKRRDGTRAPDRAFVEIDGKREYLEEWGTPATKARCRPLLAEWNTGIRDVSTLCGGDRDMTITELVDPFRDHFDKKHEQGRLARARRHTSSPGLIVDLYGRMPVEQFAPKRASPG